MKKIFVLLLFIGTFIACTEDEDDAIDINTVAPIQVQATLNFSHDWDGMPITGEDMESTDYVTANGEDITIGPRFRYLISDVTFTNTITEEVIVVDGHNLVDVADDKNLSYTPEIQIPAGEYNVSFTYGFKTEKNIDGLYQDLNSASFGVPPFLGGGYHYMQLDGKYRNNSNLTDGYNYHNIRAVNPNMPDGPPTFPNQSTFIVVDLGSISIIANTAIGVKMNVAEWFKGPNLWDLNINNQVLMPKAPVQQMMNENGQNVFSLGDVTQ